MSGNTCEKCRVHKMATPMGITRGSSLNLGWGKYDVWLVDQWVPISLCLCMLDCWSHIESFDMIIIVACLTIVFVWGIDILIISFDPLVCFQILTLLIMWLLCSPWLVHSQCFSAWHVDSLCYILSWSPLSVLFILARYSSRLSYFLLNLCVDLYDIHMLRMTVWCMTTLLLHDACIACSCGSHIYPLISIYLILVELVPLDFIFHMRLVALFAIR